MSKSDARFRPAMRMGLPRDEMCEELVARVYELCRPGDELSVPVHGSRQRDLIGHTQPNPLHVHRIHIVGLGDR
jgi:hypothetical protein